MRWKNISEVSDHSCSIFVPEKMSKTVLSRTVLIKFAFEFEILEDIAILQGKIKHSTKAIELGSFSSERMHQ